jgi:DNA repair protein RadD
MTAKPQLRPYQLQLKAGIEAAWQRGSQNVCAVSPTGSGKSLTLASIVAEHVGGAVVIAHRQELVAQLSLALNAFGVRHRIVAPDAVIKLIIQRHLREHKVTYYDPSSLVGVAGVNTVVTLDKGKKAPIFKTWRESVTFWVNDEAAHCTEANLWGRAYAMFPNINKGLGVTAWTGRGDGLGIGAWADGLFHEMVVGEQMPYLINEGFLTPFKIWTVPHSADYDHVPIGASGELVQAKLVAAEEGTSLVGDIVATYQKRVNGKRAICFLSSIKKAEEVAELFRQAGIPAMALDGKTDDATRARAAEQLQSGELLVLTNADLFGEGTDIPAVEVVIMGTRTASFSRYLQWFGRMLRLSLSDEAKIGYGALTAAERRARIAASDKPYGIVLDHAGNVVYHNGPPCGPHVIPSMDRRERRGSAPSEALPYRVCTNPGIRLLAGEWGEYRAAGLRDDDLIEQRLAVESELPCAQPYSAIHRDCPFCGYQRFIAARGTPEEVDGDLQLLDADALAALAAARPGTVEDYRQYLYDTGLTGIKVEANVKRHRERLAALGKLGEAMGKWGGVWHSRGETDSQIQRRFYHTFGVDVMSAQALKRADADKLADRVLDATVSGA